MNLLTTKEIADKLKVAEITIHKWRAENGMPFLRIGRSVRFDEQKVIEWINSNQKKV